MSRAKWQPLATALYLNDEGVCYCGAHIPLGTAASYRWSVLGPTPAVTRGKLMFKCEDARCREASRD